MKHHVVKLRYDALPEGHEIFLVLEHVTGYVITDNEGVRELRYALVGASVDLNETPLTDPDSIDTFLAFFERNWVS